jgi:hypothetical protein
MRLFQDMMLEMELWLRGDMSIVPVASAVIVAASTSVTIATIEPPTADEEWTLTSVMVNENNNQDVNDGIEYAYRDNIASLYQVMQIGNMKAGLLAITSNMSMFPNRETTFTPNSINSFADEKTLPRLRKKDNNSSYLQFKVNVKTTATGTNRSFGVSAGILRRRLI